MKVEKKERKEYDVVITMTLTEAANLRVWCSMHVGKINTEEIDHLYNALCEATA
jgi:hypothetical protein